MSKESQQETAILIEQIKEEGRKQIISLQLEIVRDLKPKIAYLEGELKQVSANREYFKKALIRANERYDEAVKHYELIIKGYKIAKGES